MNMNDQAGVAPAILRLHPRLDQGQMELIGYLEDPTLGIAGHGAGKTLAVALRGANILLRGLAKPEDLVHPRLEDAWDRLPRWDRMDRRVLARQRFPPAEQTRKTERSPCPVHVSPSLGRLDVWVGRAASLARSKKGRS